MAGPTLVELAPLPPLIPPESRSSDAELNNEPPISEAGYDRTAEAWARVGAVGTRQLIPKTLSWDLACLLANISSAAVPSQNSKRRLSLRHGVRIDTVAEYVTSLSQHLQKQHVQKVKSEWTPATADIKECYQLVSELGRGHIGVVRLCQEKRTRQTFACKSVHKSHIKKEEDVGELCSEVMSMLRIQKRFPHPRHIVELHEVLEDEADLHLILEYCRGGDLFEHVASCKRLTEKETAHIIHQIVTALEQMHACDLVHRDLKLENVLLTTPKGHRKPSVKVADFGLCAEMRNGEKIKGAAGSPFYMAPEVVARQHYGKEVDIWGLGVIMYTCLAGYLPFWGKERDTIFAAVLRASPNLVKKPWQGVSAEAKDLLKRMLNPSVKERISLRGILAHEWTAKHCPEIRSAYIAKPIPVTKSASFGDMWGRAVSGDSEMTSSVARGRGLDLKEILGIETSSLPEQATHGMGLRASKGWSNTARRVGA